MLLYIHVVSFVDGKLLKEGNHFQMTMKDDAVRFLQGVPIVENLDKCNHSQLRIMMIRLSVAVVVDISNVVQIREDTLHQLYGVSLITIMIG